MRRESGFRATPGAIAFSGEANLRDLWYGIDVLIAISCKSSGKS